MQRSAVLAVFSLIAGCDAAPPPPQNVIQDVAANNMALDEVTEVADDSASAPAENADTAVSNAVGEQPTGNRASTTQSSDER